MAASTLLWQPSLIGSNAENSGFIGFQMHRAQKISEKLRISAVFRFTSGQT
jgi:hypothetical protein